MKLKDMPRAKRRAIENIVAGMGPEDRKAWDEMTAEDEETLFLCLIEQYKHDEVWDLDGIKAHFRIARILINDGT